MLNQEERDTFRLALSAYNNYGVESTENLDIDDMIADAQIVETAETIDAFFKAHGRKLNRDGSQPETPKELERTIAGDFFKWENVQSKKGARRGTLYVMEFENACACFFDGE